MRVGRTRPIGGVIGAYRAAPAGRAASASAHPAAAAAAPITDSAEIMGIPAAELTPRVRGAIMSLMAEVDQLRQELARTRAKQAQLELLADQDTLVPVRNRRAFVRDVARALSLARRQDRPISLVFIDLTEFKQVNDVHGHTAGDAALTAVAETLVAHTRAADVVGRLGGDEFGVLLIDTDEEQAQVKAQELVDALRANPLSWKGRQIQIRAAFGVYEIAPGEDAATALAAADEAMYRHKAEQRAAVAS